MPSFSQTNCSQQTMKLPETEQKETDSILTPMDDRQIDKVEEILGYKFTDRSLVQDAMTLKSFYYPLKLGKTTARLEFLGDDMINHIITRKLYWASPDSTAGEMTRLRSANTDKEKLGRVAIANGLHHLIRHKEPQLDILTNEFIRDMEKYPIHSFGLLDPPKALSDVVESLFGAIYVDTKFDDTAETIFMRLSQPFITDIQTLGKNPVSELNEICQSLGYLLEWDNKWDESKTIEIILNKTVMIGTATYGRRRDICQNRAAKVAIDRIKDLLRDGELKPKSTAIDESLLIS